MYDSPLFKEATLLGICPARQMVSGLVCLRYRNLLLFRTSISWVGAFNVHGWINISWHTWTEVLKASKEELEEIVSYAIYQLPEA